VAGALRAARIIAIAGAFPCRLPMMHCDGWNGAVLRPCFPSRGALGAEITLAHHDRSHQLKKEKYDANPHLEESP
jgi:hypothetical protein